MNKQELIELLKNADAGSEALNLAYYEWKYPNHNISDRYCGFFRATHKITGEIILLDGVSGSVDAALGEIPYLCRNCYDLCCRDGLFQVLLRKSIDGSGGTFTAYNQHRSKSLPIAILLAVVEASV